jgi:hypothetical protein
LRGLAFIKMSYANEAILGKRKFCIVCAWMFVCACVWGGIVMEGRVNSNLMFSDDSMVMYVNVIIALFM